MSDRLRELMTRPSAALLTGPASCDDAELARAVRPRLRRFVPAETRITIGGEVIEPADLAGLERQYVQPAAPAPDPAWDNVPPVRRRHEPEFAAGDRVECQRASGAPWIAGTVRGVERGLVAVKGADGDSRWYARAGVRRAIEPGDIVRTLDGLEVVVERVSHGHAFWTGDAGQSCGWTLSGLRLVSKAPRVTIRRCDHVADECPCVDLGPRIDQGDRVRVKSTGFEFTVEHTARRDDLDPGGWYASYTSGSNITCAVPFADLELVPARPDPRLVAMGLASFAPGERIEAQCVPGSPHWYPGRVCGIEAQTGRVRVQLDEQTEIRDLVFPPDRVRRP